MTTPSIRIDPNSSDVGSILVAIAIAILTFVATGPLKSIVVTHGDSATGATRSSSPGSPEGAGGRQFVFDVPRALGLNTWDCSQPIPVVIDLEDAPRSAERIVVRALREVGLATGHSFKLAGPTSDTWQERQSMLEANNIWIGWLDGNHHAWPSELTVGVATSEAQDGIILNSTMILCAEVRIASDQICFRCFHCRFGPPFDHGSAGHVAILMLPQWPVATTSV